MEFDPICDLLKDAVAKPVPSGKDDKKEQWKPVTYWLRRYSKMWGHAYPKRVDQNLHMQKSKFYAPTIPYRCARLRFGV